MQPMMESPRITPWVGRLLVINAIVLLLQETLFTSPVIAAWLSFDPATAFSRPWTFFSYMFLHGGLFHLAANSLGLFVFGPTVERRLGSPRFIFYYLYCGLGGAVLSLVLALVMPIGPFIGASAAVLGMAVAFARFSPDAELVLFPIPVPIKAKTLVWLFVGLAVFGAILGRGDGIAHIAHLGGLVFGLLYFGIRNIGNERELTGVIPHQPRVPVSAAMRRSRSAQATEPQQTQRTGPTANTGAGETAEMDRVLDKISASGIGSLTAEERAFLARISQRKKEGGLGHQH